jgi:hypothetical protein
MKFDAYYLKAQRIRDARIEANGPISEHAHRVIAGTLARIL